MPPLADQVVAGELRSLNRGFLNLVGSPVPLDPDRLLQLFPINLKLILPERNSGWLEKIGLSTPGLQTYIRNPSAAGDPGILKCADLPTSGLDHRYGVQLIGPDESLRELARFLLLPEHRHGGECEREHDDER